MATNVHRSKTIIQNGLRIEGLSLLPFQIDFLNEVIEGAQRITNDRLISLMLFGSVIKGGAVKGVSDFDMVLVMDDGIPPEKIEELRFHLSSVCYSHGVADSSSMDFDGIPKFVMRETGMFVSHIICKESDFLSLSFSRIFDTNPLLSRLIVPSTLVIGSVFKESRTVFGKEFFPQLAISRPKKHDILKSMLMNELLVLLSLFYGFKYNSTKLAMEATKWSVYNASYFLTEESRSLAESLDFLAGKGLRLRQLGRLLELRQEYRRNLRFAVSAIAIVARLHIFLIDNWKAQTVIQ